MDLMARIKGMMGRRDAKHAEEALEARASGYDDAPIGIAPGLDREIEHYAEEVESAEEHQGSE